MPKKGENIRKRSDGRWEARYIKSRDENGKIVYGSVYAKTLKEVREKKEQAIKLNAAERAMTKPKCQFDDIITAFLKQEEYRVKQSTFIHYRYMIEKHIRPCFGHFSSGSLTSVDVENFTHSKLSEDGLSEKTVKDILSILRLILKYGMDKGLLSFEVLNFAAPKPKKKTPETFDKNEVRIISEEAIKSDENYIFAICLCLYTGLRIGEVCALKWKDIDLYSRTLTVNKTMLRVSSGDAFSKTKVIVDSPKTPSSNRVIPIPDFIVDELKKRKSKIKSGNVYFLTGTEDYIEPRRYYDKYRKFLKECGIRPHSFHCLRHTFATCCAHIGFDPKTLSEILGHSDVRVTLDRYVHPSMEMKRSYMDMVEQNF